MSFTPLKDFLIIKSKTHFHFEAVFLNSQELTIMNGKKNRFIIGYQDDSKSNSKEKGEFIRIDYSGSGISISNDIYGICTVYICEDIDKIYISSSFRLIIESRKKNFCLDKDGLLRYFAFGYQILDENTHFSGLKAYNHPIEINITNNSYKLSKVNRNDFFNDRKDVDFFEVLESMENAALKKVEKLKKRNCLFLMTGGKDSLLSSFIFKKANITFDTGTFGAKNSIDLKLGKSRTRDIFGSRNISLNVDEIKLTEDDFINHSNMQSGFGTLASIYFTKFFEFLSFQNFDYLLFSEYYEATRKMPLKIDRIRNHYVTPKNVVNDYFQMINAHNDIIEKTINGIVDSYKDNHVAKYYLFDRNIKGAFWKNPICRNYGITKMNLNYDRSFVNNNYNYLLNNGYLYERALQHYMETFSMTKSILEPNNLSMEKHISLDPKLIIYEFSNFFIELLDGGRKSDLPTFFNLEKIINVIRKRELKDKDEWFILRLLNLILFSKKNNVDLILD